MSDRWVRPNAEVLRLGQDEGNIELDEDVLGSQSDSEHQRMDDDAEDTSNDVPGSLAASFSERSRMVMSMLGSSAEPSTQATQEMKGEEGDDGDTA